MDISSDLTELARTPVAVVCAGAKSVSLSAPFALYVLINRLVEDSFLW